MTTDMSEKGLEALITNSLTNNGWLPGDPQDYERAHCVDLSHLADFLQATQPETAASLDLAADSTTRRRFLDRLKREITSRGIIDVLRKGVQHGPNEITLFYGTPTRATPRPKSATGRTGSPSPGNSGTAPATSNCPWTSLCS